MIQQMKRSRAGFTLVELIVVIAILAILAGVAIPVYSGYIKKANEAGDLQLLAAVNTAWAAACLENGVDSVNLQNGSVQITKGSADDGFTVAGTTLYNDEFLKYYAGNESGVFKTFDTLAFRNGVFIGVDLSSISFGGQQIDISSEDYLAVLASTFGDGTITPEQLTGEVNQLAQLAQLAGSNFLSQVLDPEGNPDFLTFMYHAVGISDKDLAKAEELLGKVNNGYEMTAEEDAFMTSISEKAENVWNLVAFSGSGETTKTQANALVLYAAESSRNWTASDMASTISNANKLADFIDTNDYASSIGKMSLAYGMLTAYAYKNPSVLNTTNISDGATVQQTILTRANNILESQDFKDYLASDAGRQDMAGYLASMNIISSNVEAGNVNVDDVLQNGFSDPSIVALLNSLINAN